MTYTSAELDAWPDIRRLQTARYDLNLASGIRQQFPAGKVITIGNDCDISLNLTGTAGDPVLYVLPAQVLA